MSAAVPLANVGMAGTGIGPVGRTLAAEKPALQALGREFQALGREVLGLENPLPAGVGRGNLRVRPENLPGAGRAYLRVKPEDAAGAGRGAAGPKTRATEPTTRGETSASSAERKPPNVAKAESKVWQELQHYRGGIRTNGKSGNKTRFYEWDNTHNDIEVFDRNKKHLGSMDPTTGEMYKPPKPGHTIDL